MSNPEKIKEKVGVQNYTTVEGRNGHCFLDSPDALKGFFEEHDPANYDAKLVGDPFWGVTDEFTTRFAKKGILVEAECGFYDPNLEEKKNCG